MNQNNKRGSFDSRAALDRLLDPSNNAVTLNTLYKAASAVGRQIQFSLL